MPPGSICGEGGGGADQGAGYPQQGWSWPGRHHPPEPPRLLDNRLSGRQDQDSLTQVNLRILLALVYTEHYCNRSEFPLDDWGVSSDLSSLDIKWFVPGEKEFRSVASLLDTFLVKEVTRLEGFIRTGLGATDKVKILEKSSVFTF